MTGLGEKCARGSLKKNDLQHPFHTLFQYLVDSWIDGTTGILTLGKKSRPLPRGCMKMSGSRERVIREHTVVLLLFTVDFTEDGLSVQLLGLKSVVTVGSGDRNLLTYSLIPWPVLFNSLCLVNHVNNSPGFLYIHSPLFSP
ncbi:hypothetical protein AHF37_07409 [Paragonimus kellicotti]|nr:hypothetical protein AHF37_07409 [Paragonimus kellicotti]